MRLTVGSYVSLFGDSRVTPRPSLVAFVHVHRRMSARTWRPLGRPAWLSRGAVDDLGKISDHPLLLPRQWSALLSLQRTKSPRRDKKVSPRGRHPRSTTFPGQSTSAVPPRRKPRTGNSRTISRYVVCNPFGFP